TQENDRAIVTAGLRYCRAMVRQSPLAEFIVGENMPGPEVDNDDASLLEWARRAGGTGFHIVGSCRMGNDERSVVDLGLKVRGARRLRVVDASVMPALVGANTHAPTVMIAERAADIIRRRS
ncbi:MAG: GMC oxidoreductase, partial [Sphingopyxis sp.]